MRVTVKLFATFRDGRFKEKEFELPAEATVKELLGQIRLTPDQVAILLVNGRNGRPDQELQDGDILSLFPPVGGG